MSEDAACCPLSGYDGDAATVYDVARPRAGKDHACCECGGTIARGTRHERVKGMWDNSWSTYRTCAPCAEIRDHFACGNGVCFGQLWEDLRENFFPDMKAGGQCMEGLSPEAKRKLVDARMEWYFGRGEVNDDQWEDWAKRRPT